jgi:hypothetical protein
VTVAGVLCVVCVQPCIPMGDYDGVAVCYACDDLVATILARANLSLRVLVEVLPPTRLPIRNGPRSSFYGPAARHDLDELIAALNSPRRQPLEATA